MSCGHDDFFYLTRAAKIGRAARPQEPCDNTGPTRAFVGHWGKGGAGGGVGYYQVWRVGEGEMMGVKRRKCFFNASCVHVSTSLQQKKTKAKITRSVRPGEMLRRGGRRSGPPALWLRI